MRNSRIGGVLSRTLGTGLLAAAIASGCGAPDDNESVSDLDWAQSRSGSTRYAYLWNSDLQDEFLFGVNMIKVDGFISNALNATVRPLKVKLKLKAGTQPKLDVVSTEFNDTLMSFKVGVNSGKYEIDFASAGNDLSLQTLVQQVGGQFTAENADGYWISEGSPVVKTILQDNNTVVVDLEYTVSQVILGRSWFGQRYIKERISERPGKVTARMYLVRKKTLPTLVTTKKTVQDGKNLNLGFFPSDFGATGSKELTLPIQRMPLGDVAPGKTLTYYLKDVPANYLQVAKSAVESWNIAFGQKLIKAEVAPPHVDAGDPRYHVIKWFDGTDSNLRWAGVAKMLHLAFKMQLSGRPENRVGAAKKSGPEISGAFQRRLSFRGHIGAPDYSTLSRRAAKLTIELNRIPAAPNQEDHRIIVIDSTGLKVFGEGEWKMRSHGKSKRRTWRKVHFAIDRKTHSITALQVTQSNRHDCEETEALMAETGPSDQVIADGAYDNQKSYDAIDAQGARALIPPRSGATLSHTTAQKEISWGMVRRNANIHGVWKLGREEWKRCSGYHSRSIAETGIGRFKTIFGSGLKSREFNRQVSEALYAHPSLDPFTSSLIDGSAYRSRLSHMPRLERHCPSL